MLRKNVAVLKSYHQIRFKITIKLGEDIKQQAIKADDISKGVL